MDRRIVRETVTAVQAPWMDRRHAAREARARLEQGLDLAGWPWSRRLSAWLDCLILLEEAGS